MIGWFKAMTTNAYIRGVKASGWPAFAGRFWQHNYYERVVRDESGLFFARQYIANNPTQWGSDANNPTPEAVPGESPPPWGPAGDAADARPSWPGAVSW